MLTRRETQVLALIAKGHSAGSAGHTLGVSARTIENHIANAKRKLGALTSAHAVALYLEKAA